MLKKICFSVIFICLLMLPLKAYACSCGWQGPILELIRDDNIMIRGKVKAHYEAPYEVREAHRNDAFALSMGIEVDEVLHGMEDQELITVWGDPGHYCLQYISDFPLQSEWIFVLQKPRFWREHKDDYEISVCGEYSVRVVDDRVYGKIKRIDKSNYEFIEEMTLENFKQEVFNVQAKQNEEKKTELQE